MSYHGAISNSIEDQLCMEALHYLRSHFEEATEIYKKLLIENKECCFKVKKKDYCEFKME